MAYKAYAITAGHSAKVVGAGSKYGQEHIEARKVADKVAAIIKANGGIVARCDGDTATIGTGVWTEAVREVDAFADKYGDSNTLALSIHFNSFNGSAQGTECLAFDSLKTQAAKYSAAIAKASGLEDRGHKSGSWVGWVQETDPYAYLVEVCFIDNASDMKIYKDKFNEICYAIASVAMGKTIKPGASAPAPSKPKPTAPSKPAPNPDNDLYRVLVDGKQIGAYRSDKNVLEQVEKALKADKKKIQLERV